MTKQAPSLSIIVKNVLKRKKRRNLIIRKKQRNPNGVKKAKVLKPRKVWLIKPFTKVKPSGKIYPVRDEKKEILRELKIMEDE